ncbi:MAG: chemotaxis protein CheX [Firmicutes bacterium HGW-Firmicutes-1]|nr:MAG: chemotaxis protein CheX [Firmicutes bacterium HGW-Firmicutes-1]
MVNVEYINPFIEAAQTVIRDFCHVEARVGKPYLSQATYEGNTLMIIVGITGDLRGQVLINMTSDVACSIASHMMMGMPVNELNDMAKSAISELGNMILGNAATLFSKKAITLDITPPSVCAGMNLSISVSDSKTICIPLVFDENKTIEINVAIKEK